MGIADNEIRQAKENGAQIGRLEQQVVDNTARLDRRGKGCDVKFSEIFRRFATMPEQIAKAVHREMDAIELRLLKAVRKEINAAFRANGLRSAQHSRLKRYGLPGLLMGIAALIGALTNFLQPLKPYLAKLFE